MCMSTVCVYSHPKHVVYILYQFALRKKLAPHGATCSLRKRQDWSLNTDEWHLQGGKHNLECPANQRDTREMQTV